MADRTADEFVRRLQEAERSRDAGPLVELFAADAELVGPARSEAEAGGDGARRFWDAYLKAFRRVRSTFTRVFAADGTAVLEWESDGELPDGAPIRYTGVSILETNGDRVHRFRTYYDSAKFLAHETAGV